jgi:eukaryotic translation initiation factor 2-alpha kinase 3
LLCVSVHASDTSFTRYYRPPAWDGKRASHDEKVDIFALGVVFVEMLCKMDTGMERIEILKNLQEGVVPAGVRQCAVRDGHGTIVANQVQSLAEGMVRPNPGERWTGDQVKAVVRGILAKICPATA